MSWLLCLRAVELVEQDTFVPAPAQVAALLQAASLRPAQVDRLEAGLHQILEEPETLLPRFLEAAGLVPLLERTISPDATQLWEQAMGSCPSVMVPPSAGLMFPRPVLLKATLVEVGHGHLSC